MQESRTPAPQSGEPRNQKTNSRISNPRKPPATRQSGPAQGVGHTAQPTPLVQNLWGPARSTHRQGEGTQHTQAPYQPLAGHHSQSRSLESTQHTHTQAQGGQRHVRHAGRRCSALDCRTTHSTACRSRYHTAMGNGSTPPCRAASLSEDSRSAHHRKFQPHHVGASPVTSRGDKSHQKDTTR